MLKIPQIILVTLGALILLTSIKANNESTGIRQDPYKISTSLKINDGLSTNSTADMDKNISTFMKIQGEKIYANASTTIINEKIDDYVKKKSRQNATRDLEFPSSMDIVRRGCGDEEEEKDKEQEEEEEGEGEAEGVEETMPEPQELRASHPGTFMRPLYRLNAVRRSPSFNRRNVFSGEGSLRLSKRPSRRPQDSKDPRMPPSENDCTFFTKTLCLESLNYPHEAIMKSIRGNKEMVSALLTDYNPQNGDNDHPMALPVEHNFENRYEQNKYESNEIKRRSDYTSPYENVEEGFTCPSQVIYARPQLARAVSGVWKYIINTGEHTQTLRLEKCSKAKASCSFISENYRSSCVQVYNYHRLLTWDSSLGLHMDIFKVPSCCSCHVHGYAELYPPVQKDPPLTGEERFPGADFATEQLEEDAFKMRPSSYLTKSRPSSVDNDFGGGSKTILNAGSSQRPSYILPGRTRAKKPSASSTISKPFDKLPQQHAPNTRAPGYKGPLIKPINRPIRTQNRPYRRESMADAEETSPSSVNNNWYDQDTDASVRLHNGGFDDEYQEPNKRVNYNYHPIIDFFKPEASMLQAPESLSIQRSSAESDSKGNSWKPIIISP